MSLLKHTHILTKFTSDSSKRLLYSTLLKLFFNSPVQNQNKQEFAIHFVSEESSVQCPAVKVMAVPLSSFCNFRKYKKYKAGLYLTA